MNQDPAVAAYFAEAASWDADRVAMKERSMRIAWRIAVAAMLLAALAIVALMLLMPLKRVDPFVVRVDNTTGLVDVVPVYAGDEKMPEAVTRYFLDHYITACERFNFSTAESDYEECGAFHTTIRAQVVSVSFFTRADGVADLAQVRYIKAKRQAGSAEEQRTHWIATIRYAFVKPSSEPDMRRWNPLGFKVVDFRPEPEVLAEGSDTSIATTTKSPASGGEVR